MSHSTLFVVIVSMFLLLFLSMMMIKIVHHSLVSPTRIHVHNDKLKKKLLISKYCGRPQLNPLQLHLHFVLRSSLPLPLNLLLFFFSSPLSPYSSFSPPCPPLLFFLLLFILSTPSSSSNHPNLYSKTLTYGNRHIFSDSCYETCCQYHKM